MSAKEIYDITPPIRTVDPRTAVFPGDTIPTREVLLDMQAEGQSAKITLSSIHTTVHLGAHADGENHYVADGRSIDEMPLEHYIGRCQLIDAALPADRDHSKGYRVTASDLQLGAPPSKSIVEKRIVIRTNSQPDKTVFPQSFAALDPALVDELAMVGVITVGIDTPSVDTASSKDLLSHAAFARHNIAIIEGLSLEDVPAGTYELIALPLKLVGFDASPVRAILRSI